jgi:hypothetical protein
MNAIPPSDLGTLIPVSMKTLGSYGILFFLTCHLCKDLPKSFSKF